MVKWPAAMAFTVLVTASGASGGTAQPAPPSATEIYDRTRETVAIRSLPPYIAYTQYVEFVRRGRTRTRTERIVLRLSDGKTNVTPLEEPHATPRVEDRPLLFPTSTFGLVQRRPGEQPSTLESDAPPQAAGPAVIGRVSAVSRNYDATLAGTEMLDGASVYHLIMVPRFDPRRNRIRAMFVDTATFDPRRIVIEYFAARGPLRSRPTVTFDYAPVRGTWLISRGAMDFVVRFGFFAYGGSGEFRTTDVGFPPSEPGWLFDPAGLAAHLKAATPSAEPLSEPERR